MTVVDPAHVERQRYGALGAAFCRGPMESFVEEAVAATAAVCASPLWVELPCSGTIGASAAQYRATTPEQFLRQLGSWMRCNVPARRDLFAFELCAGDDPFNPQVSVEVVADSDAASANGLIRHLFQLRLCPDTLASAEAEVNLGLLLDVLQRLPIESAYVAPAVSWTRHPTVGRPDGRHYASAVYNRALDVHSNMATRFIIGGRCRGARSLVLLDQSLLDSIGGDEAMERLQAAGLSVRRFSSGVIIQVSDMPFEAVRVDTPMFARYIALAQELEAITLFDDLDLERARFNANPDALDRYERRFMP